VEGLTQNLEGDLMMSQGEMSGKVVGIKKEKKKFKINFFIF